MKTARKYRWFFVADKLWERKITFSKDFLVARKSCEPKTKKANSLLICHKKIGVKNAEKVTKNVDQKLQKKRLNCLEKQRISENNSSKISLKTAKNVEFVEAKNELNLSKWNCVTCWKTDIYKLRSNARKQDDFWANVELISWLSNFYLLARVGDRITLNTNANQMSPR